ncbi:adenylosuccinate synthetase [Rhizobium leguminosarum]|uniref:adenylosuccinate synthetase n=1 Tax=Rhizobium leguminosarum TaxID=384 RepID=UPI003F9E08D7
MPVSVVVGGQFGSEGKGKVSQFIVRSAAAAAVVRVGGPNSGHTAVDGAGRLVTLRQLPAGAIATNAKIVLPAGSLIDVALLLNEINLLEISPSRLRIDANASIVTEKHKQDERDEALIENIGSTGSGTGASLRERLSRNASHQLAKHQSELRDYLVENTSEILRAMINAGERVVVEGTQGFGLSLWRTRDFPFATSRDTSAAAFVSEAGLAPHDVDDVAMALRSFPIRVGGNSGPLPNEIDWPSLAREAELDLDYHELTSATHRVRRIGRFDERVVRDAVVCNQPHRIFLNHMDYVDPRWRSAGPGDRSARFVEDIEQRIGRAIDYLGYGPDVLESANGVRLKRTA